MPPRLLSRREFAAAMTGLATAGLAACVRVGRAARPRRVYVGTYTEGARREGMRAFQLEPTTNALRPAGATDAGPDPSFLAAHPGGRFVYAVNELTEYEGRPSGAVSAFAVDRARGTLTLLNRRASHGGAPCYVSVDRTGRFALVANYVGGSVTVLPIGPDGALGEATAVVQHQGRGPDPERQTAPHAHCVLVDAANRFALVADLGIDRIFVYRFDDRVGTLAPATTPWVALPPGAGPRHLAFHPSGRFLYVVNELDATLGMFRYDATIGGLTAVQRVPILRERVAAVNAAADLHVAPTGRFLYTSVRGDDSVSVFAIDQATGALTPVQRIATGGHWPRNFALDPLGGTLLVANQRSNSIVGFRVDPETGRLTPSGEQVAVPAPSCILFPAGG